MNVLQIIAIAVQLVPVSAVTTLVASTLSEFKPNSTFWCATHKPSGRPRSSSSSQQRNLTTWQCQMPCLLTAASTCLGLLHTYMLVQKRPRMQVRSVTSRGAIVENHTAKRSTVSAIKQEFHALTFATVISVKTQKNIWLLMPRWLKQSEALPRRKTQTS